MKVSFISAVALGGALLSAAPVAYAGHGPHYGAVGETADCPPGTSRSGDGTCLMNSGSSLAGGMTYGGSSYSGSSYSSGYSSGSTSMSYGSPVETADCPPGTSRSGDGTCMMHSGSSMYMGSSSSYSPSTSYSSSSRASRTYGGSSSSSYTPSYSSSSTSYTPTTSYSSSSYSSRANCPAGSTRSTDGICLVQGGSSSYSGSSYSSYSSSTPSTTSYSSYSSSSPSTSSYSYSSTPLNSYRGQSSYVVDNTITSTMSDSEADYRYGSGSISGPYTDGSNTIVPFSTTSATLTNYRVAGMGSNEFLSPTDCPVNVYNPGGGKVLGCYQVSKPAPVRVSVPSYHTVRVVRPIIYVRYPVPTPLPMAMPACGGGYGYGHGYYQNMHWGRRCGW